MSMANPQTVASLVNGLGPKQAWGVVGTVASMLVASFAFGLFWKDSELDSVQAGIEAELRQQAEAHERHLSQLDAESRVHEDDNRRLMFRLERLGEKLDEANRTNDRLTAQCQTVTRQCEKLTAEYGRILPSLRKVGAVVSDNRRSIERLKNQANFNSRNLDKLINARRASISSIDKPVEQPETRAS